MLLCIKSCMYMHVLLQIIENYEESGPTLSYTNEEVVSSYDK